MSIVDYFHTIVDFRMINKCYHKLSDILLIGLFTYLSNGQDYEDMVLFGQTHTDFLKEFIELPHGIPSHDTFNRVFTLLEPSLLRQFLTDYGKELIDVLSERQICLDGKKLKGVSPTTKGNKGLYIVNAWVCENRLCIGQKKVDDKSNELTAIPELIKEIDITDALVSIDAIGCQTHIASQIVDKKGHYLLAVKKNQNNLLEDISCSFKATRSVDLSEEWEYERGRFETRKCSLLPAQEVLLDENISQWKHIKTLIKIESERIIGEKKTIQTRYYISDKEGKAAYFNRLVRERWGIENGLHWHLDVTFNEDASRVRTGNAPENLATLRKIAVQIIEKQDDKLSLKKRRVKAAYDLNYLRELVE
jgi:predicted transposase YbfD/YdcC